MKFFLEYWVALKRAFWLGLKKKKNRFLLQEKAKGWYGQLGPRTP